MTKFANKAEAHEHYRKEFPDLMYHNCTVTGGRKLPEGTKVECSFVGANNWFAPTSLCYYKGKQYWIDPKFLKSGPALSKEKRALYEGERKERSEATLMVAAECIEEREKSVRIRHRSWYGAKFFPKSMVTIVGTVQNGDIKTTVYEIPKFKLEQAINEAGVKELEEEQTDIAKALAKSA